MHRSWFYTNIGECHDQFALNCASPFRVLGSYESESLEMLFRKYRVREMRKSLVSEVLCTVLLCGCFWAFFFSTHTNGMTRVGHLVGVAILLLFVLQFFVCERVFKREVSLYQVIISIFILHFVIGICGPHTITHLTNHQVTKEDQLFFYWGIRLSVFIASLHILRHFAYQSIITHFFCLFVQCLIESWMIGVRNGALKDMHKGNIDYPGSKLPYQVPAVILMHIYCWLSFSFASICFERISRLHFTSVALIHQRKEDLACQVRHIGMMMGIGMWQWIDCERNILRGGRMSPWLHHKPLPKDKDKMKMHHRQSEEPNLFFERNLSSTPQSHINQASAHERRNLTVEFPNYVFSGLNTNISNWRYSVGGQQKTKNKENDSESFTLSDEESFYNFNVNQLKNYRGIRNHFTPQLCLIKKLLEYIGNNIPDDSSPNENYSLYPGSSIFSPTNQDFPPETANKSCEGAMTHFSVRGGPVSEPMVLLLNTLFPVEPERTILKDGRPSHFSGLTLTQFPSSFDGCSIYVGRAVNEESPPARHHHHRRFMSQPDFTKVNPTFSTEIPRKRNESLKRQALDLAITTRHHPHNRINSLSVKNAAVNTSFRGGVANASNPSNSSDSSTNINFLNNNMHVNHTARFNENRAGVAFNDNVSIGLSTLRQQQQENNNNTNIVNNNPLSPYLSSNNNNNTNSKIGSSKHSWSMRVKSTCPTTETFLPASPPRRRSSVKFSGLWTNFLSQSQNALMRLAIQKCLQTGSIMIGKICVPPVNSISNVEEGLRPFPNDVSNMSPGVVLANSEYLRWNRTFRVGVCRVKALGLAYQLRINRCLRPLFADIYNLITSKDTERTSSSIDSSRLSYRYSRLDVGWRDEARAQKHATSLGSYLRKSGSHLHSRQNGLKRNIFQNSFEDKLELCCDNNHKLQDSNGKSYRHKYKKLKKLSQIKRNTPFYNRSYNKPRRKITTIGMDLHRFATMDRAEDILARIRTNPFRKHSASRDSSTSTSKSMTESEFGSSTSAGMQKKRNKNHRFSLPMLTGGRGRDSSSFDMKIRDKSKEYHKGKNNNATGNDRSHVHFSLSSSDPKGSSSTSSNHQNPTSDKYKSSNGSGGTQANFSSRMMNPSSNWNDECVESYTTNDAGLKDELLITSTDDSSTSVSSSVFTSLSSSSNGAFAQRFALSESESSKIVFVPSLEHEDDFLIHNINNGNHAPYGTDVPSTAGSNNILNIDPNDSLHVASPMFSSSSIDFNSPYPQSQTSSINVGNSRCSEDLHVNHALRTTRADYRTRPVILGHADGTSSSFKSANSIPNSRERPAIVTFSAEPPMRISYDTTPQIEAGLNAYSNPPSSQHRESVSKSGSGTSQQGPWALRGIVEDITLFEGLLNAACFTTGLLLSCVEQMFPMCVVLDPEVGLLICASDQFIDRTGLVNGLRGVDLRRILDSETQKWLLDDFWQSDDVDVARRECFLLQRDKLTERELKPLDQSLANKEKLTMVAIKIVSPFLSYSEFWDEEEEDNDDKDTDNERHEDSLKLDESPFNSSSNSYFNEPPSQICFLGFSENFCKSNTLGGVLQSSQKHYVAQSASGNFSTLDLESEKVSERAKKSSREIYPAYHPPNLLSVSPSLNLNEENLPVKGNNVLTPIRLIPSYDETAASSIAWTSVSVRSDDLIDRMVRGARAVKISDWDHKKAWDSDSESDSTSLDNEEDEKEGDVKKMYEMLWKTRTQEKEPVVLVKGLVEYDETDVW